MKSFIAVHLANFTDSFESSTLWKAGWTSVTLITKPNVVTTKTHNPISLKRFHHGGLVSLAVLVVSSGAVVESEATAAAAAATAVLVSVDSFMGFIADTEERLIEIICPEGKVTSGVGGDTKAFVLGRKTPNAWWLNNREIQVCRFLRQERMLLLLVVAHEEVRDAGKLLLVAD
jgi:hypothetical protein